MNLKAFRFAAVPVLLLASPAFIFGLSEKDLALFRATVQGDVVGVIGALSNGANPNAREPRANRTPLHEAALRPKAEGAVQMVDIGGMAEVVATLIHKKADVNATDKFGNTPLHFAAARNNIVALNALIKAKAKVNVADVEKITPLHLAALRGNSPEIAKALIAAKANVNAKNKNGVTPLFNAAAQGNVDAVKLLLEAKADANAQTVVKGTALIVAAAEGNLEIVKLLLEAKADFKVKDEDGKTAMDLAKKGKHLAVVEALKAAGAEE